MLNDVFEQLHGKAISYNNIGDLDAAIHLIEEFEETTFAILKHNNACGLASRSGLLKAWHDALAGDPVSAFGGVLITNQEIDAETMKTLTGEIIDETDRHVDMQEVARLIRRRKVPSQELPGQDNQE